MSGPCSMCRNFTLEGVEPRLKAGGWGRCLEMPEKSATAMSQSAACWFAPSRFTAQAVVDERVQPAACDLPEELNFG